MKTENYKYSLCLSCYNRKLTEQEAEKIISYVNLENIKEEDYLEEEKKFLQFYGYLSDYYSLSISFPVIGKKSSFKKNYIKGKQHLLTLAQESLREKKFINIYVEDLDLLIEAHYDLTIILSFNDFSSIKTLTEKDSFKGLYLLEISD